MFSDENEPKKQPPYTLGQDLSDLSVDDLQELTAQLQAEIERITLDLKAKQVSKNAAASLFKS